MPRTGPTRTIQAERNLARRIKIERERRDWSLEGTAKRMTDAGCPMQGTTVYKIERLDPPRRITANELAAFAVIFKADPTDLLQPPEVAEDSRLSELLGEALATMHEAKDAMRRFRRCQRKVGVHLHRTSPGADRFAAAAAAVGAGVLADPDRGWTVQARTARGEWDAATDDGEGLWDGSPDEDEIEEFFQ